MKWKNQEEVVKYLRGQAFWMNQAANEIEAGKTVTCDWCIDLEIPALEPVQQEPAYNPSFERKVKTA